YALDLLGIDESLALRFAENKSLDRNHSCPKGECSESELLRPGFTRLSLPFFMPDSDINFALEAVALVAKHGWKLLPQYILNLETGEWKHRKHQAFLSRKWIGSISYKTGHFVTMESNKEKRTPKNPMDLLDEAMDMFKNSTLEAMRKFSTDQKLIFDAESSELRWFLLPKEATQYIF
ncbi:unnamed protein product, partial [Larinioides sclopetarius]